MDLDQAVERETRRIRGYLAGCLALANLPEPLNSAERDQLDRIANLVIQASHVESEEAAWLMFRHPGVGVA
jgi:hypothetical protein